MDKLKLRKWYLDEKLSSKEISQKYKCSEHKVNYWLAVYKIKKRTISEAAYQRNNPNGDPFSFTKPKSLRDMFLFGLGLGLYWGEGTKANKNSVRIGNTDPALIKVFINYLVSIYKIDKIRLRFQLLSYDDLDSSKLISFWSKYLSVKPSQFSKTTILKRRGEGTYKKRMKYGVLILYFSNTKLRNLICSQIAKMQNV